MASRGAPLPKEAEVSRTLEKLRKEPINTDGSQDAILAPIYTLLMNAPDDNSVLHWFCGKARPVVVEACSFLLRLHAYTDNPRVEVWKKKMAGVLRGCSGCVQGYMDAKVSSRETYFAAFSKPVLDTFFSTIDQWEVGMVLDAIKDAGVFPGSRKSLSDVPSAVLFHLLTAVPMFESADILYILQDYPPTSISSGWPTEVPPGLLLLSFHEKGEIHTWARQQMIGCSAIDEDKFIGGYDLVFQSITTTLAGGLNPQLKSDVNGAFHAPLRDYFSMSPSALWSGLQSFLRVLPVTFLKSENRTARIFCRAIIGHLHDKGPHFSDVLRAFIYLLKKCGKFLWQDEDHDYPQVVFDSIKDNPAYIYLIQEADSSASQRSWFVEWFQEYLSSLRDMPIFGDVLRKVVGFACEELQHERFKDRRPLVMALVLNNVHAVLLQSVKADHKSEAHSVVDIHAGVIVDVALSSKRNTDQWQAARTAARRLLDLALGDDASQAEKAVYDISTALQHLSTSGGVMPKYASHPPTFHTQIWKTMYDVISGEENESIALLISLVARSAHLDTLSSEAFNPVTLPPEARNNLAIIIAAVNTGLHAMRAGFLDAITQYTNGRSITARVVQSLVHSPDMAKHAMALMLSPVEELQMASQILLGQAYDVDVRSDCFRAIIQDLPVPSLDGLASSLALFNECAPLFPEACSVAKSLVRCMTDVIEVLTNGRDGLLFDEHFGRGLEDVRPQAHLPKLWCLMCTAITSIFRRTPLWSKFYEPEVMINWMRDALIFARELVAQRRTLEAAAMPVSPQSKATMASPRKPSQIGTQMLNNLQPVLTASIRWLRLTDMELLHQSSNLVLTLMGCFRETEVAPSRDSLAKIEKFLDSSRRESTPEDLRTKLSETHLSELATALSFFNQDEDDEIQIIGENRRTYSLESSSNQDKRKDSSHSRVDRPRQSSLDSFMKRTSKTHGTTVSSSTFSRPLIASSKPRPFMETKRGGSNVSQPYSLMAKVRQAAAQGMASSSKEDRDRFVRKIEPPAKIARKDLPSRPIVKDETGSIKTGDSQDSSSSDNESDEGDGSGGLASLGKLQKSPLVKKQTQRRSIKIIETKFTGHSVALERIRKREEAQRAALRMKPDLKPLHRIILSWNYDHDGPEPPFVTGRPTYVPILDQFESDQEYQRVFEPLLTLECWNQLIKSKEEAVPETVIFKINSRQYIDEWLDLDVSVTERTPDRWRLAETDIVLLRILEGKNSVLAKVQSSRRMPAEIQATLRCLVHVDAVDPGLHISTQWRLTKVFSLSTITREYAALKALPYYDFYPEIMRPRPARVPILPVSQVQQTMDRYRVNKPQAIAILGSMQTDGFSLIQGPPGTGKTSTICGMVGAFLSSRSRPATVVQVGRSAAPSEKTPPRKMLICAPSNAAIDEVAKRLKDGVRTSDCGLAVPNVVRIGAEEAINISVKDISLDQLVDQRLNSDPKQSSASSTSATASMASLRTEMDSLRNTRASKMQEMTNLRDNVSRLQALELEVKSLNNKRMTLSQQLNRLKDQQKSDLRTLDAARRKYRAEVLMDADIVCATLSGSGHEVLENLEFEVIVIDEAAQSIELSSLIPLKYRSKRCIMVGDPQQLPPTVLSPLANKFGYGQSLFVRLQKNRPEAVHLLSIQYRMHPDISRLPSKLFYAQRLVDGPSMAEKTLQAWHSHPLFGTYKFINVATGGEQQAHSGHSLVNRTECDVAVALYNRLKTEYTNVDLDFRIGVITMYRAQLTELKKKFQAAFGADIVGKVDFNTVDGFQGQEKDIIILSCVRAGPGVQSIGFLADQRRLNVAITRARASLFILGHAATLERSDQLWKEIVQDARGTPRFLDADPFTYRRPSNASTTPRVAAKPISARRPVSIPGDLKTPKDMMQSKMHGARPAASSSSLVSNEQTTAEPKLSTPLDDNIVTVSVLPQKRWISTDDDTQRPAPLLRDKGDSQGKSAKPQFHQPPVKRRPKEVSMFIPKKKPDLKRPSDPGNISQGDAKRKVIDR